MKINGLYITSIALFTFIVMSTSIIKVYADGGSVTTNIGVTLLQDDTPTAPADPTNPDSPATPVNPTTPTGGALSIDYVSNFHFGEQKISGNKETYYASFDKIKNEDGKILDRPNWVQITDKRGSNTGWRLQVQQGRQLSAGGEELKGASITIKNTVLKTSFDNESGIPTANSPIHLVPGNEKSPGALQDVIVAGTEQGSGTWLGVFGDDTTGDKSIELTVPGTSKKVKDIPYTTDITWVLTDSVV